MSEEEESFEFGGEVADEFNFDTSMVLSARSSNTKSYQPIQVAHSEPQKDFDDIRSSDMRIHTTES